MWLAPSPFLQNALEQLTRSSVGPWVVFALHAGCGAAVLVFVFVLLVALLFSLLLFCAGDPKRMVRTVLLLGPVAGLYAALHVGALVALLGWPALSVLERVLGLGPDAVNWASSMLSLSYASVGLVVVSAVGFVIIAMGRGIWHRQNAPQATRSEERIKWPGPYNPYALDKKLESGESNLQLDREPGRTAIRAGYHRIGVIAGPLFATPVLLLGIVVAAEEQSVLLFLYFGLAAAGVLVVIYGIGQLLGSLVDTFTCKMRSAEHA
jgi:hypothetical protein